MVILATILGMVVLTYFIGRVCPFLLINCATKFSLLELATLIRGRYDTRPATPEEEEVIAINMRKLNDDEPPPFNHPHIIQNPNYRNQDFI